MATKSLSQKCQCHPFLHQEREPEGSEEPIIINSGFRSPDTNQLCGGATHSNHLTGCAVDIHCAGKEQAIRYACILLDIADGKKMDFDELLQLGVHAAYVVH